MKNIVTALLLVGLVFVGANQARADYSCLDYYQSYLASSRGCATAPPMVAVVIVPDHGFVNHGYYHNNYRGWGGRGYAGPHGGGYYHGGGGGNDEAGLLLALSTTGGLITTTVAEDQQLKSAQDVVDLLIEAQNGDGTELRTFTLKVSEASKKSVSQADVASALLTESYRLGFCAGGNLETYNELVNYIASRV